MQNAPSQQTPTPPLLLYLLAVAVVVSLAAVCRFLMIMFTQLNSDRWKKEEREGWHLQEGGQGELRWMKEMKHIYYTLLALLYLFYYAAAITLPLLLVSQLSTFITILISFALLFLFGEVLPRAALKSCSPLSLLVRWSWVITLANYTNRLIPVNSLLRKMFIREIVHHSNSHPFITKDNVNRLLHISGKPVRQEEIELLEKLRVLGHNPASGLMIPKCNIFVLDQQSELTIRLVNHLSKYYFTKILIYSGSKDNVIGYIQFKQLLSFSLNQRIDTHKQALCTNIVRLHSKDSLGVAMERMIEAKVNFALIFEGKALLGLVKLKDIFTRLLLKWYNYEGLNAQRSFNSISSMISFGRDRYNLEQGEQQH